MPEPIKEGFMVFISDGEEGIGAVREIMPDGRPELVIYFENAGDFIVPLTAIEDVHFDKVILSCGRLDRGVRVAIGHAHDAEDPQYVAPPSPEERQERMAALNVAFTQAFIERQRRRLEALRDELLGAEGRTVAKERVLRQDRGAEAQELEEAAQDSARLEVEQALHNVEEPRLLRIERALRKIEEGSYGLSDESGERIPRARLEVTPEAVLTLGEERDAERREQRSR